MKEVFEQGKYDKLKELLEKDPIVHSGEADFYRGVMAENGLAGPESKEEAEQYYTEAFKQGMLKAGVALARVYQKDHKIDEAQKIYQKISESTANDQLSIEYAKYRLARIEAKELLESENIDKEEAKAVIEKYTAFLSKANIPTNSPLRTKVLYHSDLVELRLAEAEMDKLRPELAAKDKNEIDNFKESKFEEALDNNRERKSEYAALETEKEELEAEDEGFYNQYAGIDNQDRINEIKRELSEIKSALLKPYQPKIAKKEKELRAASLAKLEQDSGLNRVKALFDEIGKRYSPAAAELFNIEARKLFKEKKYDKAIEESEKALAKDKSNVNARLIQAQVMLTRDGKAGDELLKVVRGATELDPTNRNAIKQRDELSDKLSKIISDKVIQELKDNTRNLDGTRLSLVFDYKGPREKYIDQLGEHIKESLQKSEYLKKHAKFENVGNIVKELTEKIITQGGKKKSSIEQNIRNDVANLRGDVIEGVTGAISTWDKDKSKYRSAGLSDNEEALLKHRLLFKQEVVSKLSDFYHRCHALTQKDTDVTIVDGIWSSVGDIGQMAGSFAAAFGGGAAAAVGGGVIKVGSELAEAARKKALVNAAKKFCGIGQEDSNKLDDKLALAAFDRVASSLVERYGMQIDNVEQRSIELLADVATEKMLYQIREASVASAIMGKVGINPIRGFEGLVKQYGGLEKQNNSTTEEILLKGVIEGKAKPRKEPAIIHTDAKKRGGDWLANEVFECPAATSNGKDFYSRVQYNDGILGSGVWRARKDMVDPAKYGATYLATEDMGTEYEPIPDTGGKSVSGNSKGVIKQELDQHLGLINSPAWISEEERTKTKKVRVIQSEDNSQAAKGAAEEKKWTGIVKVIAGTFTIGVAKILGAAFFAGAVISGAIVPIAITAACVGVAAFMSGVKDFGESTRTISKLERDQKQRDRDLEDKRIITPELQKQQELEQQKERENNFKNKQKDDMYLASKEGKGQAEALGYWASMFVPRAKTEMIPVVAEAVLREGAEGTLVQAEVINSDKQPSKGWGKAKIAVKQGKHTADLEGKRKDNSTKRERGLD